MEDGRLKEIIRLHSLWFAEDESGSIVLKLIDISPATPTGHESSTEKERSSLDPYEGGELEITASEES